MSQLKILIVDDDLGICEYMRDLLQSDGCHVATVGDPATALTTIGNEKFHIIILDLMMPKLSGIEMLRQLRHIDREVAVIIITGYPSLETATDAIDLDINAYMKKPFSGDELRQTIARVARKRGIVVRREDELHVVIGKNIRLLRKLRGMTLKELQRRTGLAVGTLSQIERAEQSASVSNLYKIASALDVRLTELFGTF